MTRWRNLDLDRTNRHVRHRRLMDRLTRLLRAYTPRFDRRYP